MATLGTGRRFGIGIGIAAVGVAAAVVWAVAPGRSGRNALDVSPVAVAAGQELFTHEWTPGDPIARGDGLGPVFNARSCVACHSQGGVGGGGGVAQNVQAFEVHPTTLARREVLGGMVHKFAVEPGAVESVEGLRRIHPVVHRGPSTPEFDPVRVESINSTALFGAGRIETIPSAAIVANQRSQRLARMRRELHSEFRGAIPGRVRILPDGRVGKFGWKAQFATLEEFVASACANELGLGNPLVDQARPLGQPGEAAAGTKAPRDLDAGQVATLVAFVGSLPPPRVAEPVDPEAKAEAARGEALFHQVGCADCHTPDVGGVSGVYTDFLLHRLEDQSRGEGGYGQPREVPPVPLPEEHPVAEEWRTPALWGVADSAPYFHDGGSPTLQAAIVRHLGDAADVTETYRALPSRDQAAVLAFLRRLRAPAEAVPGPVVPVHRLVMAR